LEEDQRLRGLEFEGALDEACARPGRWAARIRQRKVAAPERGSISMAA